MRGSRGGLGGSDPPPPERSQKYRISKQEWTGSPEILKILKATTPAFNVVPSSARHFRWRADDGPLLVIFGSYLP